VIVSNVNYVTLLNGQSRKSIKVRDKLNMFINEYTEGIGGWMGLKQWYGWREYDDELICVKERNVSIMAGDCPDFVGIDETENEVQLTIYPNPTNDVLSINLSPSGLPADFQIYDISGKLVIVRSINDLKTQIPVNGILPGEYFYSICSKDKEFKGKIVISR